MRHYDGKRAGRRAVGTDSAFAPSHVPGARSSVGRRLQGSQRDLVCAADRLPLGGCLPGVCLPSHLLTETAPMGARRHLGADLASTAGHPRRTRKTGMELCFPRRELCVGNKGDRRQASPSGGKGSKVIVVADVNGLSLELYLDSACPHEATLARKTLETVRVPRRRGRPRQRPRELVADKAYDSRRFREWLQKKGIEPTIPPIERPRKRAKGGRPVRAGPGYRERWKVERLFAWLGQFCRLEVRYERLLSVFRGFVLLTLILICLRQFWKEF